MIDVQNQRAKHNIKLGKVGITGLEYPVMVKRGNWRRNVIMNIEVSVDLPPNQRGAHMSRFVERIEETFKSPIEITGIEHLAEDIVKKQLQSHAYAKRAQAKLTTKIDRNGKVYELIGRYDTRNDRKIVGVKVIGAIACPCAIKLTGGLSHNQRAMMYVEIDTSNPNGYEKKGLEVEAEDLVEYCEKSFSIPLKLRVKREDEMKLVREMHSNPRFVEDCVRRCVHMLRKKYRKRYGKVECISYESIHPFDVFAEWKGIL